VVTGGDGDGGKKGSELPRGGVRLGLAQVSVREGSSADERKRSEAKLSPKVAYGFYALYYIVCCYFPKKICEVENDYVVENVLVFFGSFIYTFSLPGSYESQTCFSFNLTTHR
jgi:hypothetical protein